MRARSGDPPPFPHLAPTGELSQRLKLGWDQRTPVSTGWPGWFPPGEGWAVLPSAGHVGSQERGRCFCRGPAHMEFPVCARQWGTGPGWTMACGENLLPDQHPELGWTWVCCCAMSCVLAPVSRHVAGTVALRLPSPVSCRVRAQASCPLNFAGPGVTCSPHKLNPLTADCIKMLGSSDF